MCANIVVTVGIGVLEHEKVNIVTRPAVLEVKCSIQCWERKLWHHLHRPVQT